MSGKAKESKATMRSARNKAWRKGFAPKSTGKHNKTRPWKLAEQARRVLDKEYGEPRFGPKGPALPHGTYRPSADTQAFMDWTGVRLVPVNSYGTVVVSAMSEAAEMERIIRMKQRPT